MRVSTADLRDTAAVDDLVEGQEVVFSVAGQVSHIDSMTDPIADLEINCRSQLSLLEALRRRNPRARVVFAGSRQQYGRPRYLPVDEEHPLEPVDVNGIHKAAAESATLLYHRVHGLPACSLRLTNTYGPRMQMRHPRQGFVAWFVRLAVEGREIELFGGGESLRDFNEVEDVVDAFLLCGTDDAAVGQVFNLGHPEPVTVRQFAELLLDVAGGGSLRERPFPADRARIDIGSVFADYGKIRERLGWEPRIGLREGLDSHGRLLPPPSRALLVSRVRFFDPRRAYEAQREELDAAFRRVLESEQIVLGPEVEAFEREFAELTGTTDAVGVASGTDALELALRALELPPQLGGDLPEPDGKRDADGDRPGRVPAGPRRRRPPDAHDRSGARRRRPLAGDGGGGRCAPLRPPGADR